jgi:hypothetical protein
MELLGAHGPALGGGATTDRKEAERQGTVHSNSCPFLPVVTRVLLSDPPRL